MTAAITRRFPVLLCLLAAAFAGCGQKDIPAAEFEIEFLAGKGDSNVVLQYFRLYRDGADYIRESALFPQNGDPDGCYRFEYGTNRMEPGIVKLFHAQIEDHLARISGDSFPAELVAPQWHPALFLLRREVGDPGERRIEVERYPFDWRYWRSKDEEPVYMGLFRILEFESSNLDRTAGAREKGMEILRRILPQLSGESTWAGETLSSLINRPLSLLEAMPPDRCGDTPAGD